MYGLENGRAYGKDYNSPEDEREKMRLQQTYRDADALDALELKYKNAHSLKAYLSDYNVFFNARQAYQAKKENKRIQTIK